MYLECHIRRMGHCKSCAADFFGLLKNSKLQKKVAIRKKSYIFAPSNARSHDDETPTYDAPPFSETSSPPSGGMALLAWEGNVVAWEKQVHSGCGPQCLNRHWLSHGWLLSDTRKAL